MKKFIFSLFFLVFLLGSINAAVVVSNISDATGGTITWLDNGLRTGQYGQIFRFNESYTNLTLIKEPANNATRAFICTSWDCSTVLANGTFSGNAVNFTYTVTTGMDYYILKDGGGYGSGFAYLERIGHNGSYYSKWFPQIINGVNWSFFCDHGGDCTSSGTYDGGWQSITAYNETPSTGISVSLISPSDDSVLSASSVSLTTFYNLSSGTYNWTNGTYYIWYSNGTSFNVTTVSVNGTNNVSSLNVSSFIPGGYVWNIKGSYGNATFSNSTWASSNYTFTVGGTLSSITYNTQTYETSSEDFSATFDIVSGGEISLAQLVYNGTNYTITNISQTSTTITLSKSIDIPLNIDPFLNQTNNFTFIFTYGGGAIQQFATYQQNVSFINFQLCNTTYSTQALNFTLYDEINQTKMNGTANPTNFESNWRYWLGSGGVYKTYSFQNLSSALVNYSFCILPYQPINYTFRTSGDIIYSATDYRENQYHLSNATLTNLSSDILLYLLHTDYATKFFLTFRQGTDLITDATVTVQKFFTGLGTYNTVGILSTDDNGEATMWQQVDQQYRYSIVKNGELLGTVDRVSICSVTPCTLTILLDVSAPNPYESYYDYYAQNILSNLSYNRTSHIVTYDFIDTTGLANYFRLTVKESKLNATGDTICDSKSYSTAGTITCNMTDYNGEFVATGYISRSPEKVDKVLNFLTEESTIENLGLTGIFLIMGIIITMVFAGAVVGRGSPSVILGFLGATILGLKIVHLFPFTWVVTVTLEIIIFYMMSKVKS